MFFRIVAVGLPLLLLGLWLVRSRRPVRLDPTRQDAALVRYRRAVGWRCAGLGLGAVAAAWTANFGSLGLGVMLAPTAFGLCVIAGVAAGELANIPRSGSVRTVAPEARSVVKYLPRRLGALVAASTFGLGALLAVTTLMGSADDLGRAGRSLFRQCNAETSASGGPWPGLFYSVPLGMAVGIGFLGAGVALRTVVLAPRAGSDPDLLDTDDTDDTLRQGSAEAVVAATGVMVAASLFGVALTAGGALIGFTCPPTSWIALGVALIAVAVLMLLLALWCLVLLLRGPRIRPPGSGDTGGAG